MALLEKTSTQIQNKIRGSLIGGAIGDALGYPIEFFNLGHIKALYGDKGLKSYIVNPKSGKALISDDTQMTLFTANALLCNIWQLISYSVYHAEYSYFHTAYLEWYRIQNGEYLEDHHSWLCEVPELAERRAPGITCMSALSTGFCGLPEEPINNSKGCGGVMRVTPAALCYDMDWDGQRQIIKIMALAAIAAAITHGHPLGWLSAAALAYIVNRAAFGEHTTDGLYAIAENSCSALEEAFPKEAYVQEMNAIIRNAVALAKSDVSDEAGIEKLGEGWTGDEALAIALFCALRHSESFSDAIIAAANHSGDSDSTASICGNIVGAWLGFDAIDKQWIEKLELVDVIQEIADDLSMVWPILEIREKQEIIYDVRTCDPARLRESEELAKWSVKYNEGNIPPGKRLLYCDADMFRKEGDIAQYMAGENFADRILKPFLETGRIQDKYTFRLAVQDKRFVCGSVSIFENGRNYRFPMYVFIGIMKEASRQHLRRFPYDAPVCKNLLEEIERKYLK